MEAVAIVGSILIAFALDAWWDRSQAQVENRERLEAVLEEVESAEQAIEWTLRSRTSAVENSVELRRRLTEIPLGQRVSVPDSLIAPISHAWVTEIQIGNAEEFLSAEGANVDGGLILKQATRTWLTRVEDVQDDEKQFREFISRDMAPFLRSRFNLAVAQTALRSMADSGLKYEPMVPVQVPIETSVELLNLLLMMELDERALVRDTRQLRDANKALALEIRDALGVSPDTH